MAYSLTTINLISAFLIIILGLVLGNVIGNIFKRVLKGLELGKVLRRFKLTIPIESYFSTLVKYVIIAIAIFGALSRLGLSRKILYWGIGIILLITIIFILLAFKDWIPNVRAGFKLKKTQKIKRGDHLHVKGASGEVIQINLFETKIKTKDGDIIFVPNSLLNKENLEK